MLWARGAMSCNCNYGRGTPRRELASMPETVAGVCKWLTMLNVRAGTRPAPRLAAVGWAPRGVDQRSPVIWRRRFRTGDQMRGHTKPVSLRKSRLPLHNGANHLKTASTPI